MTDLILENTIPSGQCFRFKKENNYWTVTAGVNENVRQIKVSQDNLSPIEESDFWSNFFDLNTDYQAMRDTFSKVSPIMEKACHFAPGIRILNQNPWEALCSFVVSQNNNIKRIMGIVDRMCSFYGKTNNDGIHGFPDAQTLAGANESDLKSLGLGFRSSYILNTATAFAEKRITFEELDSMDVTEASKLLMTIKGIGPKVADCALLFGCHRLECFPKDVWIKRVMETCFEGMDQSVFGQYAGVAQQYLFHWARTSGYFDNGGRK